MAANYNIGISEAERNIRPMTIERSNSKSFGSHEGVESSAVYHTIIATCKAQAINRVSVLLEDPSKGLIIRPGVWFRTHSYQDDGVSLILAEEEYSRDKYTYDYEEYKRLRKKQ